jgi:hypothetical protein
MDTRLGGRVADHADGLSRAFAGAGVGLSSLPADGQAAEVADAAVAFDTLKPFQVHPDLAAKVTFDHVFPILNRVNDLGELLLAQVFRPNGGVNVGLSQNVLRVTGADAVNVTQRNIDALIWGNFYTYDTSHILKLGLALPLFVPSIGANDADDALALNDFAVFAKFFD